MAICCDENKGLFAYCDKCGKEIFFNRLLNAKYQLKKLGWSVKYNYRYNKTICPECLRKRARKLEKHFGLFDLYKDNEAQNG